MPGCSHGSLSHPVSRETYFRVWLSFLRNWEFAATSYSTCGVMRAKVLCLTGTSSPTLNSLSSAINYRGSQPAMLF